MIRKTEIIDTHSSNNMNSGSNNSNNYDDSPSNVRELSEDEIFMQIDKLHHRTGKVVQIKHLNLTDFKRIECPKKNAPHNHKSCYYYHSIKDKRRDDNHYTPELCKFADTEKCPKKDKCRRAHNRVERLYHKDKYKTKFCHCFPNKIQQCEYGDYCSFAHSVEDIKVRLIHHLLPQNQDFDFYIFYFKTEWCPYNHEHNKAQCVYAHNFQDFRRKPNLFKYDTELCEDWQSGTFITCYEEGCKRLQTCHYSHGWKEQQFHPLVYKTQPCEEQKCFKGFECPFYHSTKDRRIIEYRSGNQDLEKLFIPKERQFKCSQQPTLMELYFDNNLNHMKELEIATAQLKNQQKILNSNEMIIFQTKLAFFHQSLVSEDKKLEKIEKATSSTKKVTDLSLSKACSCQLGEGTSHQEKHHTEIKPQRSFKQESNTQQQLQQQLLDESKQAINDNQQIHESKIPIKYQQQQLPQQIVNVTPPRKRQILEEVQAPNTTTNRTNPKGQMMSQQQYWPSSSSSNMVDKTMAFTPTSQQYNFHLQSLQQQKFNASDFQSPYHTNLSMSHQQSQLYQSPQNFQQHMQKSQALFNQQQQQQQMNSFTPKTSSGMTPSAPSFNKKSQCFYPSAYHSPMHQTANFQRIQSPPGLIHPSQQQSYLHASQQHTPTHNQMYAAQQNQQFKPTTGPSQSIQHRPLHAAMNAYQQRMYQSQWMAEDYQPVHNNMMMQNASLRNQDLLFSSQQNNKLFEAQDFNEMNQFYLGGSGGTMGLHQQLSSQKKVNFQRNTPLHKAVTAVELKKKSSNDSDESDSLKSSSNNYDSNNQMNIKNLNANLDTTPQNKKMSRDQFMMRSCPLPSPQQQVTPSTIMTDSFYKDKLNNLAESYKRLNLDFNDIQEDEFESEQAAGNNSYKVPRSVLEQNDQAHQEDEQDFSDPFKHSTESQKDISAHTASFPHSSSEQQYLPFYPKQSNQPQYHHYDMSDFERNYQKPQSLSPPTGSQNCYQQNFRDRQQMPMNKYQYHSQAINPMGIPETKFNMTQQIMAENFVQRHSKQHQQPQMKSEEKVNKPQQESKKPITSSQEE